MMKYFVFLIALFFATRALAACPAPWPEGQTYDASGGIIYWCAPGLNDAGSPVSVGELDHCIFTFKDSAGKTTTATIKPVIPDTPQPQNVSNMKGAGLGSTSLQCFNLANQGGAVYSTPTQFPLGVPGKPMLVSMPVQ